MILGIIVWTRMEKNNSLLPFNYFTFYNACKQHHLQTMRKVFLENKGIKLVKSLACGTNSSQVINFYLFEHNVSAIGNFGTSRFY